MSTAKQLILENGGDDIDPKDYADQTVNEPPAYTEALEDVLQSFCSRVRGDYATMLKDGVHRVLSTDKGWRRRFPNRALHARLLAHAVLARRADKLKNEIGGQVRSMRRIVDNWLRFS